MVEQLVRELSSDQRDAVENIKRFPVGVIPGEHLAYQAALAVIYRFASEVERYPGRFGSTNPAENREMNLRLQVLASHFACEPGWKLT